MATNRGNRKVPEKVKERNINDRPTAEMKARLMIFVVGALALLVLMIVVTMFKYAVTEADKYREFGKAQQLKSKVLPASRGTIYDSNMDVLARSATVYTVFIDPAATREYLTFLEDPDKVSLVGDDGSRVHLTLDEICSELAEMLDLDKDFVMEKAQKDSMYEKLKVKVEKEVADKVEAFLKKHKIHSVQCEPDSKRYYPQNEMAAAVIGYVNADGNGVYGLEAYYDEELSGVDGRTMYASDRNGNEIPYKYKQSYDAKTGHSLILNIDMNMQMYLEKALQTAVDLNKPKERACGIIMNCKTGQIYAMASSPGYDLNNPTEIFDKDVAKALSEIKDEQKRDQAEQDAWGRQSKNKAITELYNPGSVFKVITGSSSLEEGAINLSETFVCEQSIKVADRTMSCWANYPHGAQTFAEAMVHSCNPAFIQIGQKLGAENFCKYFKAYGFTEKTGIDLPAETMSQYIRYEDMGPVELASCSFGQSNKVTPIQMITAYAACINGGYLVTPQVVDRIVDTETGNVIKDFEPVIKRQVISEETSATMREVLENVVNTEQGSNSYIQGYRIGGKSGTSQKIDVDQSGNTYVASYCGFAPADDPEVIVLVMVDDPTGGKYYGSQVAAPVVTEVLEEVLPYMGYFPEYTEEELERLEVTIPSVEMQVVDTAVATIENADLEAKVIGEGSKVVRQVPATGAVPRGCTVVLYTEEDAENEYTNVPDLYGCTLEQARSALDNAGLNYQFKGSAAYTSGAICNSQNYRYGDQVPIGTIIEVGFMQAEASSQ